MQDSGFNKQNFSGFQSQQTKLPRFWVCDPYKRGVTFHHSDVKYYIAINFTGPSGTNAQNLAEEDAVLVHDIFSPERDANMLYHERVGPELTRQVWNLTDEDIDGDFPIIPEQYPSVYVNPAQGLQDSFNCIIRWILPVLCLWSSFSSHN